MCFVLLGRGTVDESSCERKNRGQIHHRNGKYIGHPVTPPLPSHRQGPRWTPFVQMEREGGGGRGQLQLTRWILKSQQKSCHCTQSTHHPHTGCSNWFAYCVTNWKRQTTHNNHGRNVCNVKPFDDFSHIRWSRRYGQGSGWGPGLSCQTFDEIHRNRWWCTASWTFFQFLESLKPHSPSPPPFLLSSGSNVWRLCKQ